MKKIKAIALITAIFCLIAPFAMASDYTPENPLGIISTDINNSSLLARLNCAGNYSYNFNNRNVDIYYRASTSGSPDQLWRVGLSTEGDVYQERCYSGTTDAAGNLYALNVYRYSSNYYNCDVMRVKGNEYDSRVVSYGAGYDQIGSNHPFQLKLYSYDAYLGCVPDSSCPLGYNVKWVSLGNHTNWYRLYYHQDRSIPLL